MSEKNRTIIVATMNPSKFAELSAMLDADVRWVSLSDFQNIRPVIEDGRTFAENARKKATGYSKATGLWTIADDSGLIVDALEGQPGVKSARFAGEKTGEDRKLTDKRNTAKVLKLLKDIPAEKRTARFVCHLCLADGDKILAETEGTIEGIISQIPAGENGFGYDPIFFVPGLNKSIAQLSTDEKNAISHRGRAIRKLKPVLDKLLQN